MRRRELRRRRDFSSAHWRFCVSWVALALSLLQGLSLVHSTRIEHHPPKVVGSTNLPVKVYVRQHHNSPHILCLTNHLRNSELIDPIFEWHGPSGDLVTEHGINGHKRGNWAMFVGYVSHCKGNESVTISPTGTLLFQHFKSYMSGIYTCSLVFKPTTEQEEKSYLIKYVIYAYSDPNFYYEFTARYHSAPCNSIYNASFERKLLQILAKLVVELACEVSLEKSECHHVKMQRAGMQNELFFTFKVFSLEAVKSKSMCQKNACDVSRRLRKAKDLIEKFFSQQVEVLGKRTAPLPEIYYIEGTLQMVWINRCFPGYGINSLLHPDCPNCCVVCSPGSFNPHEGTHCLQCNRSLTYGAKHCY